ncbi:MAG: hypothetical protein JST06_09365 [Bacteroidetes bacterium]|nr:hypothetical protein [Bacteroidota bacterium]MBS1630215.1 hypothetical protein [Bacteroidota bacterium]
MTRSCSWLLLCLFLFNSCAAQNHAERKLQSALHYGMTHAQALAVIPNRSEMILGEFNFPEGHMQAFQYTRFGNDAFKVPRYYLYFLNDTLVRKSPEENLREGSKLALQEHASLLANREKAVMTAEKQAALEEKRSAEAAKAKAKVAERQADIARKKAEQAEQKAEAARKKALEATARSKARDEALQQQEAIQDKQPRKKSKKQAASFDDDEDDW